MLVPLDLSHDIVSDKVGAHLHGIVEDDVFDGEVDQVDGVMDRQGHDGGVVIGKDGRDTQVEGLLVRSEHGHVHTQEQGVVSINDE